MRKANLTHYLFFQEELFSMFTETYNTALGFLTLNQIKEANNSPTGPHPFTEGWALKHIPASFIPFIQQALVQNDLPAQMSTPHVETALKVVSGAVTLFVVEKNPSTKWVLSIQKTDDPELAVSITVEKKYRGMTELGLQIISAQNPNCGFKRFDSTPAQGVRVITYSDFVDLTSQEQSPYLRVFRSYDIAQADFNPKTLISSLTAG